MRQRRGWGRATGLALAALLLAGGCAADRRQAARPDDDPTEISADRLDDLDEAGFMADFLDPEERQATARAGLAADADPDADRQDATDTTGEVGLSLLTVAPSVGAIVAPFFLF